MSATTESSDESGVIEQLEGAAERREQIQREIDAAASEAESADALAQVEATANAVRRFDRLLKRYEESATGTGDFGSYVEFQQKVAELVEGLDEGLPRREAFETAMDVLDQRRLTTEHFERARDAIEPARDLQDLLERREDAREQYRNARLAATDRRAELDAEIEDLERLEELAEVDLDAPIERLREPIEAYNESVREAYQSFESEASARELLSLFERASSTPLVEARAPPADLMEYVREYPAGTESVPTLLEYAEYSASKLDHYVEDAGALRARVATHRTYLDRRSADPFTLSWPPDPAERLRFRTRELRPLVATFAPEETVARLRTVRRLPQTTEYDRLQTAATAIAELDEDQRDRVASGAVAEELATAKQRRADIEAALESFPPL